MVVHVNQEVVCKLLFLGAMVDPNDTTCLLVNVDLPDRVLFKANKKPTSFSRYFSCGATQNDKFNNMKLASLRRSML